MGFAKPNRGEVFIAGLPVKDALKRGYVAYVPQSEDVDWDFPVLVEDVVMMGRYGHMNFLRIPSAIDKRKVDDALERVDMTRLSPPPDRRVVGRPEEARVSGARACTGSAASFCSTSRSPASTCKPKTAIVELLRQLRASGHLMLVSTHNLGSVPDFCDHVVLLNREVLAAGPTATTFTQKNLELAFGGVLRRFRLEGGQLHDDDDRRRITVLTDDERRVVFYGERREDEPLRRKNNGDKS